MSPKDSGSLGTDVIKSIYTNSENTEKNPQPLYIVHKDTMKSFLYENKNALSIVDRLLTVGVTFITIIITYFTSNFKDTKVFGLDGSQVKGVFLCLSIGFGVYLIYLIYTLFNTWNRRNVDGLCEILEKRVTVLFQTNKKLPEKSD